MMLQKIGCSAFLVFAFLSFGRAEDMPDGDIAVQSSEDAVSGNLLLQVAAAMNQSDGELFLKEAETDMPDMEIELLPILAALPKNSAGKYDPSAVRYALHHHFSRRHGWRLKGLDPVGEAWNSTSPANVSALQHMPAGVQSIIEDRLTNPGFNDYEVAVLGLTFKFVIHVEARHRLNAAHDLAKGFLAEEPEEEVKSEEFATALLDVYMSAYILRTHPSKIRPTKMQRILKRMTKIYPYWPQTQNWTRTLFASARSQAVWGPSKDVEFSEIARTVELIEEQYGPFQQFECLQFKNMLLPLEYKGTGRVRLSDFYAANMNGTWQFAENVEYLRELGALDESDPANPFVIIPNYNNGYSNAVGATPYHDVGCITECEPLIEAIEKKFTAPAVAPNELAEFVATLSTSTIPAYRGLSTLLLQRLHSIAEMNDGVVPIYGRLFAQWMHHAFPRECNYPHVAGTTSPKNPVEWAMEHRKVEVEKSELEYFAFRKQRMNAPLHTVPWLNREELPANLQGDGFGLPVAWVAIQLCALLVTFFVLVVSLARTACRASRHLRSQEAQKKAAKLDAPAMML